MVQLRASGNPMSPMCSTVVQAFPKHTYDINHANLFTRILLSQVVHPRQQITPPNDQSPSPSTNSIGRCARTPSSSKTFPSAHLTLPTATPSKPRKASPAHEEQQHQVEHTTTSKRHSTATGRVYLLDQRAVTQEAVKPSLTMNMAQAKLELL